MSDSSPEARAETIPQQFARMVQRHAPRTALIEDGARLSYAELDAASNRIAHAVQAAPSDHGAPIVILLGHGRVQISAILGVLKAGRAYCALDPSFPRERSALILGSLQSQTLITDTAHMPQAHDLAAGECRVLDVEALGRAPATPILAPVPPDALAVVLFTSGTSGAPKGIMRTQRELVDRAFMIASVEPWDSRDVASMLYSCSFSSSTTDLYTTLCLGAALCIYDVRQRGPEGLGQWIQAHQVTRLHVNASVLRQFLGAVADDEMFPSLRVVRPSQRLYRHDVERLWRHLPSHATVIHGMGSTETGMIARLNLQHGEAPAGDIVPVGKLVPGVEVRLVDAAGQPTPPGDTGEMLISSPHLASGYWRNPELTAQKFFVDPATHRRFYRLGDLARWRPDGLLELAGRKDFQVKVRGYRVELGEVEAALEQLGTLRRAVVVAETDAAGENRLIAYVVPAAAAAVTVQGLRHRLRQVLPGYMVPFRFIILDALPLLPNGKVDRRALPAPGKGRPELDVAYAPPRTPYEVALCRIWSEVLDIEAIGVDDAFLDLGGNSLQATRIASRVLDKFQVDLPLPALFSQPTVAAMAGMLIHAAADTERLLAELEVEPQ